jgi:hypothetical protein
LLVLESCRFCLSSSVVAISRSSSAPATSFTSFSVSGSLNLSAVSALMVEKLMSRVHLVCSLSRSKLFIFSASKRNFKSKEPIGVGRNRLVAQALLAPSRAWLKSCERTGFRVICGQFSSFQRTQFLSLESTVFTMR